MRTYTVLGFIGYAAAIVLAIALGNAWHFTIGERLIVCIAPPAMFVMVVTISTALRGVETIVFYECALAAIASVLAFGARVVDVATLGIGVFLVFGRLGCLSVACCHGRPGYGVCYGDRHVAAGLWRRYADRPLWPIQAIESLGSASLVVAALVLASAPGDAARFYATGYAVMRFALELARGDVRPTWLGISEAQWISIVVALLCGPGVIAAGLLVSTCVLVATRRHRALWSPRHLREIDRMTAGVTSLGITVSRHDFGDGRTDWILSPVRVDVAKRIARGLFHHAEVLPGSRPGVVHVIAC